MADNYSNQDMLDILKKNLEQNQVEYPDFDSYNKSKESPDNDYLGNMLNSFGRQQSVEEPKPVDRISQYNIPDTATGSDPISQFDPAASLYKPELLTKNDPQSLDVQDEQSKNLSKLFGITNPNDPLGKIPGFQVVPEQQAPINSDKIVGNALSDLTQNDMLMQRLKAVQAQQDKADKAIGNAETNKIRGEQELRKMQLMSQQNLGNAQGAANQNQLLAGLLRAGLTTGAAIGRTKADYSGVEGLEKGANQPVESTKESEKSLLDFQKLIQNEKLTEEQIAARKETAKLNKMMMQDKINTAQETEAEKRAYSNIAKLNPDFAGGRTNIGILQRKINQMNEVKRLMPKTVEEFNKLTTTEQHELAVGVATAMAGTGTPTKDMIAKFEVPETYFSELAKFGTKVFNQPVPPEGKEFTKVLSRIIDRGVDVTTGQKDLAVAQETLTLGADPRIAKTNTYKQHYDMQHLDPEEVAMIKSGKAPFDYLSPSNREQRRLAKESGQSINKVPENKQLNTVSGRILVSKNGHRLYIDPSDLDAARKDGYIE